MGEPSLAEYLAKVRNGPDSVRDAVDALRNLTTDERLRVLDLWIEEILAVSGGRPPAPEPGHPFWRHWKDPSLGRPA